VFNRTPGAINDAVDNTPLDHGFVKLYGGTIFRRENDWLIVSAIGGGSWGMQAMSSPDAAGPYSAPVLVLWPQSDAYHPSPTEPYPAFEAAGFVYAPFTGLNSNREFQVMYRAPLERATERSKSHEPLPLPRSACHSPDGSRQRSAGRRVGGRPERLVHPLGRPGRGRDLGSDLLRIL